MDEVSKKFTLFKSLLTDLNLQYHDMIKEIYNINVIQFLYIIRQKYNPKLSDNDILSILNIPDRYTDDIKDKIRKYVSYFYEISKIL